MSALVGIDVGVTSVKLAQLNGSDISLHLFENKIGKNLYEMNNQERLSFLESLKEAIATSGIKVSKIVASIPQSLVFGRTMSFPYMSTPELSSAIKWELDQMVPFPPDEAEMSWSILDKPEKAMGDEKIRIYVVAVPTKVSELYANFFEAADLEIDRLEDETPGLFRALENQIKGTQNYVFVSIGATGTILLSAHKGILTNVYYYPLGGVAITKYLADSFGLPMGQAEMYKRTYGMNKTQLDGKVAKVLEGVLMNMVSEIKKMIVGYKNEFGVDVENVYLSGGGVFLPDLLTFVSANLEGVGSVEMFDPLKNYKHNGKYGSAGGVFTQVVGLIS